MKNITDLKRAEFFRLAVGKGCNVADKCQMMNIRSFYVYRKSVCDLKREKLIAMVIVSNFLLVLARLPNLTYLILISIFNSELNFLRVFLNDSLFIYVVILSDVFLYFSQSVFIFVYLAFDRQFRKCYETIFRHICYFKIHLPRMIKSIF